MSVETLFVLVFVVCCILVAFGAGIMVGIVWDRIEEL